MPKFLHSGILKKVTENNKESVVSQNEVTLRSASVTIICNYVIR